MLYFVLMSRVGPLYPTVWNGGGMLGLCICCGPFQLLPFDVIFLQITNMKAMKLFEEIYARSCAWKTAVTGKMFVYKIKESQTQQISMYHSSSHHQE